MSITRPPAIGDGEADEIRSRGGRIYQTQNDPRVSWALNWFMGVVSVLLTAALIGVTTTMIAVRDDVRDLKREVAYLKNQMSEIHEDRRRAP